jgi:hypothetical protein
MPSAKHSRFVRLKFRSTLLDQYLQRGKRELDVWIRLRHAHVLPLYGVAHEFLPGATVMVCPWLENGTVTSFVASRHNLNGYHRLQLVSPKKTLAYFHIELFARSVTLLLVSTIVGTHLTKEDYTETNCRSALTIYRTR